MGHTQVITPPYWIVAPERVARSRGLALHAATGLARDARNPRIAVEKTYLPPVIPRRYNLGVLIGSTISHYKILSELGRGGMGVVYKAQDTKLDRTVALKFLAPHLLENEEACKRFHREAKAAAGLNHPNICTVYEISEEGGQTFLAMEFIEGESLDNKIERCPLSLKEALGFARQVANGLAAAHANGVVHRDIKPGNLVVTPEGRVKILDFGLALLTEGSKLTQLDTTLGTVAYMSPEQAQGMEVDHRTDLWALGCVTYEMVCGQRPFRGVYDQAMVYEIVNQEPEPLTGLRTGVPMELEWMVGKCLAKDTSNRYQSAADLIVDLRNLAEKLKSGKSMTLSAATVAATDRTGPTRKGVLIVVLPFQNRSRDEEDEYFSDGVTEDVISTLGNVQGIRVVPRSSAFHFKGRRPQLSDLVQVLRVTHVLEGSVRRSGDRLRITVELVDAEQGDQVWTQRFDRVLEDIFDVQDEIARSIADKLFVKLAGDQGGRLGRQGTSNIEAYTLYLRGLFHYQLTTKEGLRKGITCLEQTCALDPGYARARASLGFARIVETTAGFVAPSAAIPKAKSEIVRALDIDESIAEAHVALGIIRDMYEWNWRGGEESLKRAVDLAPDSSFGRIWYSHHFQQVGLAEEAIKQAREALQVDPLSNVCAWLHCCALYTARRFDEAIEQSHQALELHPLHIMCLNYAGLSHAGKGDYEEALSCIERAAAIDPANPLTRTYLAWTYGVAGLRDKAEQLFEELLGQSRTAYAPACHMALACAGLGRLDEAFHWLDEAFKEPDGLLSWSYTYPLFDPLRSDPRFDSVLQRLNFS